jgi:hypothetical protein
MGVIPHEKSLVQTEQLSTASFCRRRLAVVLVRLKMAESVREAATFVEQGHVRVGPNTVTDPAFHVTRNMEDFVTWVDTSKIKRKVRGGGAGAVKGQAADAHHVHLRARARCKGWGPADIPRKWHFCMSHAHGVHASVCASSKFSLSSGWFRAVVR